MQEALTTIFGFGVLTLAAIALLNVACLRLHEVQKKDEQGGPGKQRDGAAGQAGRFSYTYVYDSKRAFEARDTLRSLPSFLGWTGVAAIVFVQLLHGIARLTVIPHEREFAAVLGVITWMSAASYVLVLLCVAAVVSNKVYGAMDEVNRG